MNNRLKYRAWITPWSNGETPVMVYINDLKLHAYIGNWEKGIYKDAVFMQHTGMRDRRGNDIYEGDIVQEQHTLEMAARGDSATVGVVYFAAGTFLIDGDGPLYDHVKSESPEILEDYVVVSNKYQSPNLLTKPENNQVKSDFKYLLAFSCDIIASQSRIKDYDIKKVAYAVDNLLGSHGEIWKHGIDPTYFE